MPTDKRANLFIVGAQKSGTSALSWWLSQHPQVCMSFPKEPGFLAFGGRGYPYRDGYGKAAPASKYVVTDAQAYANLFSRAMPQQHVIGEASTWYFNVPGTADRIKAYNPAAKILVILRNPVERAYSAWCHARSDGLEPCKNFDSALQLEHKRTEVEFLLRYRQMGLYSEALARYQAVFPASQLCVLFYDDLRANPLAVWQHVCAFLQLDMGYTPAFERRYNRTGQPRYRLLHKFMRSYRLKRVVNALTPHSVAIALKQRLDDFNLGIFPEMEEACRTELRQYYYEDMQALSQLTNRNLNAWLY